MPEIKEIAANMNFCEEKNQERKNNFIIKSSKDIDETENRIAESPMSNLAFRFGISTLATPKSHKKSPEMKRTANYKIPNDICGDDDKLTDKTEKSDDIQDQFTAPLLTFPEPKSPKNVIANASTNIQHTPTKYTVTSNGSRLGNRFKVYDSVSSGSNDSAEMEDAYLELMEMENMDEESQMPNDLKSLLCKDVNISKTPDSKKSVSFSQKLFSMDKSADSAVKSSSILKLSRITSLCTTPERQCLATINENVTPFGINCGTTTGGFKRPDPPTISPNKSKRHKGEEALLSSIIPLSIPVKRPTLRKTVSMNDAATIMDALSRSSEETDLIGDFSKRFCLPYIDGRHKDLRSISAETMRQLLLGEFDDCVKSYKIIDCRYPYEYEGGHIRGAVNLYTQEQIIENLVNKNEDILNVDGDDKRNILIFHCEFSSERGPKLSRFLRNHDRMSSPYPALQYPEVYLLHGGYKDFFQKNSDLCVPNAYRTMLDSNYSTEYKNFRAKSKSWAGDGRSSNRLSKSRSRLVL